jgi:hypothetical protein
LVRSRPGSSTGAVGEILESDAGCVLRSLLPHHLAREIPNEEQDMIRLGRRQFIRMSDWDAPAGQPFQMAEVAVSRQVFADILSLIARLRAPSAPARASGK